MKFFLLTLLGTMAAVVALVSASVVANFSYVAYRAFALHDLKLGMAASFLAVWQTWLTITTLRSITRKLWGERRP